MLRPNAGRALSAIGAIALLVSPLLVWYHVERPYGIEDSTLWDAFPRLRLIVLAGVALTLVTALVRQTRWVLVARTVLGVMIGALVLRRIIDPPDISSPVVPQPGVYVTFVAALLIALGGLVDSGRELMAEVAGLGRSPRPELPPAPDGGEARRPFRWRAPTETAVRVPNHAEHQRN